MKTFLLSCFLCLSALGAQPAPNSDPNVDTFFTHMAEMTPSGTQREVTVTLSNGEKVTRKITGTAKGLGFKGSGKNVETKGQFDSPHLDLPDELGGGGDGGGGWWWAKGAGFTPIASLWKNPLFWLSLLLFAAAGATSWLKSKFPYLPPLLPVWLALAGVLALGTAICPAILLVSCVTILLTGTVLLVYYALHYSQNTTLFSKVASGIDSHFLDTPLSVAASDPANIGKTIADLAKEAIATKMNKVDAARVEKLLKAGRIGKYAEQI